MYEGVGVHGEMDDEMIFESIVGIDLLLDDTLKGLGHFSPKIIIFSGFPALLKRSVETVFINHVYPVPTGSYGTSWKSRRGFVVATLTPPVG